ncbi:J domain-containing protein [Herbaspirillum sp. RU 5E]|uniref:J domain-containing protein n=1 Tax=Herbaspirillum aquaticum TaxID=568783 RepID=A0A225SYL1_9BURK|nr:J domain-containing protein [Herbaspirillum aquaticum]MBW9332672.1 J domain-containing protein [Herbaspirillum sp. RU 5E]OWY35913.1 J domain-containing protein [Herbaspirillum aquaticum]
MYAEWNKWAWDLLQLAPTTDTRAVKRAYAAGLKTTRPDDDAERFQKLRQAYELALNLAQSALEDDGVAAQAESIAPTAAAASIQPAPPEPDSSAAPINIVTLPALPPAAAAPVIFQASRTPAQSWEDFLRDYANAFAESLHYSLANALTKHTRGQDFDNLDFAQAFELEAARYCAQPDPDPDLIEGLNAFYRWEENPSHLNALQPGLTWPILSELRALRMHQHLVKLKTEAARALLADSPPTWSSKLYNRRFTEEMQQLIQHMRWNCPEILHRKLNAEVIAWWEPRLTRKRLQGQHLLASIVLGIVFSAMLFSSLDFSKLDDYLQQAVGRNNYYIGGWLLGQLLFLVLVCLQVFGNPSRSERLGQIVRSRNGQLFWIIPAALLDLLLMTLQHSGPWVLLPLCLGLSVVALYVICIGTPRQNDGIGLLKLIGLFIGMWLVFNAYTLIFGPMFLPWAYLLVIGGEYYYRLLDAPCKHLTKLRAGWLLLSVLTVAGGVSHGPESSVALMLISWSLAVMGMVLSDIYAHSRTLPFLCVFTYFMVNKFANLFVLTEMVGMREMSIPMTMLVTTMVFTICNLLSRAVSKRAFS